MRNEKRMALLLGVLLLAGNVTACSTEQGVNHYSIPESKAETIVTESESAEVAAPVEIELVREIYLDDDTSTYAAIMKNGDLYTWGNGALGIEERKGYQPVKILENVAAVEIETTNGAALTKDGCLYMWGDNEHGQLGNGTTTASKIPIKVLDNVASMDIEGGVSSAITTDGTLYMWGKNEDGQIGNGSKENCLTPTEIMGNVASVTLAGWTSSALTKDGVLYMWGAFGTRLPADVQYSDNKVPVRIMENIREFHMVDGRAICAYITNDNMLYMWGDNGSGQLGDGTTNDKKKPVKVLENVVDFDVTTATAGAVTEDGTLYMWGSNRSDVIVGCSKERVCSPFKVMDDAKRVQIYSRDSLVRCTVITQEDDLYIWGDVFVNSDGGVDKENEAYQSPVKILENVLKFSVRYDTNAAVTAEGELYMWGYKKENNLAILPLVENDPYAKTDDDSKEGGWYLEPVQINLTANAGGAKQE